MQDTIILGNGTSKQIKTASLPDNYAEFKAMAENGNLFADIKLNADGCEVVGTPLNKLNLLTDETTYQMPNVDNVDKAINFLNNNVNGIPVDLTGIYNTQVIGYDEMQGKLVPMINVARTETVVPNYIEPVPWEWVAEPSEWVVEDTSSAGKKTPKLFNAKANDTQSVVRVSVSLNITKPYILSEFTNLYCRFYLAGDGVAKQNPWYVELSKTQDFNEISATYQFEGSAANIAEVNADITNLIGSYYIRFNLLIRIQTSATTAKSGYVYMNDLSFS